MKASLIPPWAPLVKALFWDYQLQRSEVADYQAKQDRKTNLQQDGFWVGVDIVLEGGRMEQNNKGGWVTHCTPVATNLSCGLRFWKSLL